MKGAMKKGVVTMLAVMLAATIVPLCINDSSDGAGESQTNPIVFWNKTIILTPEIQPGEITDPNSQVLEPPTQIYIEWGDASYDLESVDGYFHEGDVEVVHTYATTGTYHITCTPQCNDPSISFTTYELWVDIMGAPTVYFYDGEDEITRITAENGFGVGDYENDYFTPVSAPAEEPTKTGKVFVGWYKDDAEFDFSTIIKAPTTLQAHWVDEDDLFQHKITYFDGTTSIGTQKVLNDVDGPVSMLISQADPVKDGYTFKGWATAPNGSVQYQKGATVSVGTSGLNLYAVWEQNAVAPTSVTVYIDGNVSTFNIGTKVGDIPAPVLNGYTFVGWYSDEGKTNKLASSTVLTNGMHLYTKWDKNEFPGKTVGEKFVVTTEKKISDLVPVQYPGSNFEGWYLDADCTQKLAEDAVLTEGMVLYAHYTGAEPESHVPSLSTVIGIAVVAIGAIVAIVGLRYHPYILIVGIVIAAVGGLDLGGIINLF